MAGLLKGVPLPWTWRLTAAGAGYLEINLDGAGLVGEGLGWFTEADELVGHGRVLPKRDNSVSKIVIVESKL